MQIGHSLGVNNTKVRGQATIPMAIKNILKKYNATLLLPGPSGNLVQTFQPGNYVESTGQTLAPVDSAVGFVADAAGALGVNLANNVAWSTSANVVRSGNQFTLTAATATLAAQQSIITANKTYEVEFAIDSISSGSLSLTLEGGTATTPTYSTVGTYSARLLATHTGNIFIFLRSTPCTAVVRILGVREITGIHATQATTQYKPSVRRGLVNLLTYSNDFSNAAWGADAVTKTPTKLTPTTASAIHRTGHTGTTVVSGQTYTAAVVARAAGYRYLLVNGAASPNNGKAVFDLQNQYAPIDAVGTGTSNLSIKPLGDDTYLCTVTGTAAATLNSVFLQVNDTFVAGDRTFVGDGISGIEIFGAALFQGTLTAQQIIDAGGIPVTTSAPASSTRGSNYWQFDGTDDRLQLSQVPFQMSDDHFVVAGAKADTDPTIVRTLFGQSANTNDALPRLALVSGQKIQYYVAGGGTSIFPEIPCATTDPFVVSARKSGNIVALRANGGGNITGTLSGTYSTATSSGIGSNMRATPSEFFNGLIHAVIFGKGAITDNELLTLERFVAKLQGRTL